MIAVAASLLLFAAASSAEAAPPARPDLSWMVGNWRACAGGEAVEEHWLGRGQVLAGVNVTTSAKAMSFENLGIRAGPDGRLTYFASPGGKPAVAFALKEAAPGKATFENLAHDFPKRIIYRRDGEALVAQVTDEAGNGPSWRFVPATGSSCP